MSITTTVTLPVETADFQGTSEGVTIRSGGRLHVILDRGLSRRERKRVTRQLTEQLFRDGGGTTPVTHDMLDLLAARGEEEGAASN